MAFAIKVNPLGSSYRVNIMWLQARVNMQSFALGSSRNAPPLRDKFLRQQFLIEETGYQENHSLKIIVKNYL